MEEVGDGVRRSSNRNRAFVCTFVCAVVSVRKKTCSNNNGLC